MRITALVENTSTTGMPVEHGLSLYIQLNDGQHLLFDMGQGKLFAENAQRLGLHIVDVDTAIISHGHYDHGGGLKTFLELNKKAKIYIHQDAFQPHYSLRENGLSYIGLDKELQENERLIKCSTIEKVNSKMMLFADVQGNCFRPVGNHLLFGPSEKENDRFTHEQNLVIEENNHVVLFAGCAHNGIVNILQKAEQIMSKQPTHVLSGMHLVKSGLSKAEENDFISSLANKLTAYHNTKFYTMHCTGTEQYGMLHAIMGDRINYLSCGENIEI